MVTPPEVEIPLGDFDEAARGMTFYHHFVARRRLGVPLSKYDVASHSANMLLARDENGSDHYFMLELLGAELTDHKTGKKVPYIGFSEVRVKEFTNAPGNKKFQTFEWAGYHWTKQLIGNPLGEEYSATELKSIIQEYAREMPDYDTTRYACHEFQEGIRRRLGLFVPPPSHRTRIINNYVRPVVGSAVRFSAAVPAVYRDTVQNIDAVLPRVPPPPWDFFSASSMSSSILSEVEPSGMLTADGPGPSRVHIEEQNGANPPSTQNIKSVPPAETEQLTSSSETSTPPPSADYLRSEANSTSNGPSSGLPDPQPSFHRSILRTYR